MIHRNTRETALSRPDFHIILAEFLVSGSRTVGSAEYGQTAWVWVKHLGNRYYLNSDSTTEGVASYLALLQEHGQELSWSAVGNAKGRQNKAAFGPNRDVIEGFYLYREL